MHRDRMIEEYNEACRREYVKKIRDKAYEKAISTVKNLLEEFHDDEIRTWVCDDIIENLEKLKDKDAVREE